MDNKLKSKTKIKITRFTQQKIGGFPKSWVGRELEVIKDTHSYIYTNKGTHYSTVHFIPLEDAVELDLIEVKLKEVK